MNAEALKLVREQNEKEEGEYLLNLKDPKNSNAKSQNLRWKESLHNIIREKEKKEVSYQN